MSKTIKQLLKERGHKMSPKMRAYWERRLADSEAKKRNPDTKKVAPGWTRGAVKFLRQQKGPKSRKPAS